MDIVLSGLNPQDEVFSFGYRQALKVFDSAVKKSGAICEPNGDKPSWKDLRSGMACHLFKEYRWTKDDINLRLGHSITSRELEAYFSYLAGQSKSVKKLHYNNNLNKVQQELEEIKQREKMWQIRNENLQEDISELKKTTLSTNNVKKIILEDYSFVNKILDNWEESQKKSHAQDKKIENIIKTFSDKIILMEKQIAKLQTKK